MAYSSITLILDLKVILLNDPITWFFNLLISPRNFLNIKKAHKKSKKKQNK